MKFGKRWVVGPGSALTLQSNDDGWRLGIEFCDEGAEPWMPVDGAWLQLTDESFASLVASLQNARAVEK